MYLRTSKSSYYEFLVQAIKLAHEQDLLTACINGYYIMMAHSILFSESSITYQYSQHHHTIAYSCLSKLQRKPVVPVGVKAYSYKQKEKLWILKLE